MALVALTTIAAVGLMFQQRGGRREADVPSPFGVVNASLMVGSLTEVGDRRGVRVRMYSFDGGEEVEELQGATHTESIDFILTPNASDISHGARLCDAFPPGKKYYGYQYSSRTAAREKLAQRRSEAEPTDFSELFPGTFFASGEERAARGFVGEFESQRGVVFRDPCEIILRKDSMYLVSARDPLVTFRARGLPLPPIVIGEDACSNGIDDDRDGMTDAGGVTLLNETVFRGFPLRFGDNSLTGAYSQQHLATIRDAVLLDPLGVAHKRPMIAVADRMTGDIRQHIEALFPTENDTKLTLAGEEREMADIVSAAAAGELAPVRTCSRSAAQQVHGVATNEASYTSSEHVVHVKVNTQDCTVLAIATGVGPSPFRIVVETIGQSAIAGILTDTADIVNVPAAVPIERYDPQLPFTNGRASGLGYYVNEAKARFGVPGTGTSQVSYRLLGGRWIWIPRRGFVIGAQDPALIDPRWTQNNDKQWWWVSSTVRHGDSLFVAYNGVHLGLSNQGNPAPGAPYEGYIVRLDVDEQSNVAVRGVMKMPDSTPFAMNLVIDAVSGDVLAQLRGVEQRPQLARFSMGDLSLRSTAPLFVDARVSSMVPLYEDTTIAASAYFSEHFVVRERSLYVISPTTTSRIDLDGAQSRLDQTISIFPMQTMPQQSMVDPASGDLYLMRISMNDLSWKLTRLDGTTLTLKGESAFPVGIARGDTKLVIDAVRQRVLALNGNGVAVFDTSLSAPRLITSRTAQSTDVIVGGRIMGSSYPWRSYDRGTGQLHGAEGNNGFAIDVLTGSEQSMPRIQTSDTWIRALLIGLRGDRVTYDTTANNIFFRHASLGPPLLRTELLCNP